LADRALLAWPRRLWHARRKRNARQPEVLPGISLAAPCDSRVFCGL